MRLARLVVLHDQVDPTIEQLVDSADLDMLQWDYRWPRSWPAAHGKVIPWKSATGFARQLSSVHRSLYLDPKLRIITNAGGWATSACVEALGQNLCEHGNADLPITAIRGDNVLPRLEEFLAAGVSLAHRTTDQPFKDLDQPILSAQVQLGAGPFATACDEGSRIIVAGSYDLAAPLLGAAVSQFGWKWDQYDTLAGATLAAHLGAIEQCETAATDQLMQPIITLGENGAANWHHSASGEAVEANHLRGQIVAMASQGKLENSPDVGCNLSAITIDRKQQGQIEISGATGRPPAGDWPLCLRYRSGYAATALLELAGTEATAHTQRLIDSLQEECDPADPTCQISIGQIQQLDAGTTLRTKQVTPRQALLRIEFRCQQRERVAAWIGNISRITLRQRRTGLRLLEPWPSLQLCTSDWPAQIPRELIDISVDTRPASEWA